MAIHKIRLALLASVLALALSACGGSGGGGNGQVSVPNVVGDTQAAATTAITGAGLTLGAVTMQSSGTVSAGSVISESPAADTSVASGSSVALVVSSGPVTYTVGGTLIGLASGASVDVLNGADQKSVSANGTFALPTGVASGGAYNVTVGMPSSAQTCDVQNASGTVAAANVTNVVVYCTYSASDATLKNTYTEVAAGFDVPNNPGPLILDLVNATTYDGMGNYTSTGTVNIGGNILTNATGSGTYMVTTTDAVPSLNGNGGIEGVNGAALVGMSMTSGTPPLIALGVLPGAHATTASVDGNYMRVGLFAQLTTGDIEADQGPVTFTNGVVTGTYTENLAGTITAGNKAQGTFTVSNGLVSGTSAGAVSADGNLIVVADVTGGDDPSVEAFVLQGSGVTSATFEGVYSVAQYGGDSLTTTFGNAITLFAYGDGTWSITFTKNADGTITSGNTGSGTYTVAADGTLTLTDSGGNVYNGALSADGNVMVLASVTSGESPAIAVGVRQ